MKKLFFILLIPVLAFADIQQARGKLINHLVKVIFPNKKVKLYIQDPDYKNISTIFSNFSITHSCEDADFLILTSLNSVANTCKANEKITFVTSYNSYKEDKDTFGAIFWQKGRLNLIFRSTALHKLSISLPEKYDKYIE